MTHKDKATAHLDTGYNNESIAYTENRITTDQKTVLHINIINHIEESWRTIKKPLI